MKHSITTWKTFGDKSLSLSNLRFLVLLLLFLSSCGSTIGRSTPASTPAVHISLSPSAVSATAPATPTTNATAEALAAVPFASALPAASPLTCANQSSDSGSFIQTDGIHFLANGTQVKLSGFTFYPALLDGASAWYSTQFPQYIDRVLNTAQQLGQNLIRTTDFWDKHYQDNIQRDHTIWHNIDYLVCAAAKRHIYVELDVSAFEWFLVSQHKNAYDANNWTAYLTAVGKRYGKQPDIAFYSILGEATPPKTVAAMQKLVAFYRSVTDTLYQADSGNHLISAGGFNHMEEETTQTQWWQQIYALPHNNIAAFKTYSQDDLNLLSTITDYAHQINRPALDEEFGMEQASGDGRYTGVAYYGIQTSRAQFFQQVYTLGAQNGVQGFVFWNLGCKMAKTSYDVNPQTSAVWKMIQTYAPTTPVQIEGKLC